MNTTILYLTDNALDPFLAERCRDLLLKASDGLPIVSVSQKPLDLGENICMEGIGRSAASMERQTYTGLSRIQTKWVAFAEHDCVYSTEHFQWIPPDDESFWYNDNVWLCQYRNPKYPEWDGMFSYLKRRRVQSQLICATDLLREASKARLEILSDPAWVARHPLRSIGEPGAADPRRTLRLANYRYLRDIRAKLKSYITQYQARDFATRIPNIDIRHGDNLTGQRRGKRRCFALHPWGTIEDVLGYPQGEVAHG
jgi:hypothetical protein